jgi:spermidine synthase
MTRWIFLAAYAASGLAGLVYEVAWTRLLTLYIGHATAATSTVVAAFMGGLAAGSLLGSRAAVRVTRRQALLAYAALELLVLIAALLIPLALGAIVPALAWAYRDGEASLFFPVVRVAACLLLLSLPAMALGATFPFAVRWFVRGDSSAGRSGGALYAANTAGAALGALTSAFVLLPRLGLTGATIVAVAAGSLAGVTALVLARGTSADDIEPVSDEPSTHRAPAGQSARRGRARQRPPVVEPEPPPSWMGGAVLALSGCATFLFEIAWARVSSSVIGPSTYAFAATLTGVIAGLALGSVVGSAAAGRARRPALPLAIALGAAALAVMWVTPIAGRELPVFVIGELSATSQPFGRLVIVHAAVVGLLAMPAAGAVGAAFPLALEIVARRRGEVARRLGSAYAVNTVASVAGSLAAGFLAIPLLGLQNTLRLAAALLALAAFIAVAWGRLPRAARFAGVLPAVAAVGLVVATPAWDRELLAGGGYKYAARVPSGVDVATALRAGTLLHYREGATGIVSVKELTGIRSLSIDGKVDASSSGDMLTQKLLAHLPLLLHEHPDSICIIGLGSGVTLASALVHPAAAVDVVEISPEVVEASRHFAKENRGALDDPRTRLILGDGRSHLALSSRTYDVIISEPSNPWMAGVAALFTREFFTAVRGRLRPDGIFCQWAHTYDISDADLRSIVATFASVFPNGTMWLIGEGDLLLVGGAEPVESRLGNVETAWARPGVAEDLREVSVQDPFALWSLFVGGPSQLKTYGANAAIQTDDRMALEFSGPAAINASTATSNADTLRRLLAGHPRPPIVERALAGASAAQWRERGAMLVAAAAYRSAYDNYATAISMDPEDAMTAEGLVRTAVASGQESKAIEVLKKAAADRPRAVAPRLALSRALAATNAFPEAVAAAEEAIELAPDDPAPIEQLASIYADTSDANGLAVTVAMLRKRFPERAATRYYTAGWHFMNQRLPQALDEVQQAIRMDASRSDAHNLVGAIHATQGRQEEARAAFRTALRLDPRGVTSYTNLGLLELSAGRRAAAADLFAQALTLDPESGAAREGLARSR